MSVLQRTAHLQGRRDEVPNQELARDLAARKDRRGLREIAANLQNQDKNTQADCIKVLYEVGYIEPTLVAEFAEDFARLLRSKNNRLVWGGMIGLSTVAAIRADVIHAHLGEIRDALSTGSVITVDAAVLTLARLASTSEKSRKVALPLLIDHLMTCRPKDVPQHAEKSLPAVNRANKKRFATMLQTRLDDLSSTGLSRVKKVLKQIEAL